MNKEFATFVRVTGEYKVPFTSFCTNGQLLKEDVVDCSIDAGISEIVFSVDGATAATYEEIRRGAKWERLLRALELLRTRKQQSGVSTPVGRINFTCMAENMRELPGLVRLAMRRGQFIVAPVQSLSRFRHGGHCTRPARQGPARRHPADRIARLDGCLSCAIVSSRVRGMI